MKAILLQDRSDPTSFVYGDVPEPQPEAGAVLVQVHAAAVTPTERDWVPTSTTRAGTPRPFPVILGHEFSGVIRAVGSGVTDLAAGQAVFGPLADGRSAYARRPPHGKVVLRMGGCAP